MATRADYIRQEMQTDEAKGLPRIITLLKMDSRGRKRLAVTERMALIGLLSKAKDHDSPEIPAIAAFILSLSARVSPSEEVKLMQVIRDRLRFQPEYVLQIAAGLLLDWGNSKRRHVLQREMVEVLKEGYDWMPQSALKNTALALRTATFGLCDDAGVTTLYNLLSQGLSDTRDYLCAVSGQYAAQLMMRLTKDGTECLADDGSFAHWPRALEVYELMENFQAAVSAGRISPEQIAEANGKNCAGALRKIEESWRLPDPQ